MTTNLENQKFAHRHPRLAGAVWLAIGLAIAKWQIYNPLHAREYGYAVIHIWPKLVGLAIILSIYGSALCIFGGSLNESFRVDPNNMSWRFALVASGIAFFSLAVYISVMISLNDQGYVHGYF